jgi:bifunctional N-acetylglucosamine-1-phosphate-uridyltransferase/glucosamine-1-phosphate-acetyltransferase GlmU-like protein
METEVQTKTLELTTDMSDVFVLVLLPQLPAFGVEKPLELKICGRSVIDHVLVAIGDLPHKQLAVEKSDDILTLVREHAGDSKYTCVLYADTPLMTAGTFEQAVTFVRTFGHKAAKMPRGWIFETEYIKAADMVAPEEIPNLPPEDFIVAYSYAQLAIITQVARQRINLRHLAEGVQMVDPNTTYIDAEVAIERGVIIEPNVYIRGETVIGKNVRITMGSKITDSVIGEGVVIKSSRVLSSVVGDGTVIGPYANLREGNKVGKNCRISNFVELKKSIIGDGTKIAHMSYVGDATIGRDCNIGCGVVFANYNGKTKSKVTLGDRVFVGSNCNLVAPLVLEDDSYVAAGSTINKDVPKHALAIARTMMTIKENYWNVDKEGEEE